MIGRNNFPIRNESISQTLAVCLFQYMMPTTQSYQQHPSTLSNVPFSKPMFNNHSDFASLPPVVNVTNLNQRTDSNELLDGMEQRRWDIGATLRRPKISNKNSIQLFSFSDPCLAGNSDNESPNSDDNSQKIPSAKDDNHKLFKTLLEQIHILHETNSKICRNLHENMGQLVVWFLLFFGCILVIEFFIAHFYFCFRLFLYKKKNSASREIGKVSNKKDLLLVSDVAAKEIVERKQFTNFLYHVAVAVVFGHFQFSNKWRRFLRLNSDV